MSLNHQELTAVVARRTSHCGRRNELYSLPKAGASFFVHPEFTSYGRESRSISGPSPASGNMVGIPFAKTILLTVGGTATMKLNYVIEFVADMGRAVKFYRDVLGLSLKFQSPGWSEFSTGETSLGLHPASEKNPAGSI